MFSQITLVYTFYMIVLNRAFRKIHEALIIVRANALSPQGSADDMICSS